MRAALLLLALAAPAAAQEAITAERFEALVEGRTLAYGGPGESPYGFEHYREGRRVTWAFAGDDLCLEGRWYPEARPDGPAVCFVYVDDPEPQCWRFFEEAGRLRADFLGEGGATLLYELTEPETGLVCGGVGV